MTPPATHTHITDSTPSSAVYSDISEIENSTPATPTPSEHSEAPPSDTQFMSSTPYNNTNDDHPSTSSDLNEPSTSSENYDDYEPPLCAICQETKDEIIKHNKTLSKGPSHKFTSFLKLTLLIWRPDPLPPSSN